MPTLLSKRKNKLSLVLKSGKIEGKSPQRELSFPGPTLKREEETPACVLNPVRGFAKMNITAVNTLMQIYLLKKRVGVF